MHNEQRRRNLSHDRPLISVIIPAFNRQAFIRDAIGSVMAQTYQNWELIVVDDASTDDTVAIARAMSSRVRVIVHEKNRGVSAARNTGIHAAKGEFVALLDSDDVWLPDKLEQQYQVFVEHPTSGLVGGGAIFVDKSLRPVSAPSLPPVCTSYEQICVRVTLPGSASNVMIPCALLERLEGFDESMQRAEDWDLWLRIARDFPIRNVQAVTVQIRVHDEPRPSANLTTIRHDRLKLAKRIPEPNLRRKNLAWTHFVLFQHSWRSGKPVRSMGFLAQSFAVHPWALQPGIRRLRAALAMMLGR